MYWPDLRYAAEMDRRLSDMAELRAQQAKLNADEAYRRKYGPKPSGMADVEDAQWREVPTQQLTAPDT